MPPLCVCCYDVCRVCRQLLMQWWFIGWQHCDDCFAFISIMWEFCSGGSFLCFIDVSCYLLPLSLNICHLRFPRNNFN
jgi:hypothetical protein